MTNRTSEDAGDATHEGGSTGNIEQTPAAPREISGVAAPDAVAERAYRRYQDRGGGHGRDLEDWLEAEQELLDGPAI